MSFLCSCQKYDEKFIPLQKYENWNFSNLVKRHVRKDLEFYFRNDFTPYVFRDIPTSNAVQCYINDEACMKGGMNINKYVCHSIPYTVATSFTELFFLWLVDLRKTILLCSAVPAVGSCLPALNLMTHFKLEDVVVLRFNLNNQLKSIYFVASSECMNFNLMQWNI